LASPSERVLITGGTGFTGVPLASRLRRDGYAVVALSHEGAADALTVDVRDFDGLTRTLARVNPGVILHLAGIAAPSDSRVGEMYSNNVVGTANLFAALTAAALEPRIVILASSAQVYAARGGDRPLSEDAPLAPTTHYAVSKLAAEQIAALYSRQFPVIIARPFNYTGPGQTANFLVPKIVRHYAEGSGEIRLGNLDLFRDFSDIERVVEAYARLITRPVEPTTVNICSGRAVHLSDIITIMDEIAGHSLRLVTDPQLKRDDEPRTIIGSPRRLEALVGALPNPEFRATLERMYETFRAERHSAVS
jgi:GDP-6-deoxy-D-talose 4-dehydrogenase